MFYVFEYMNCKYIHIIHVYTSIHMNSWTDKLGMDIFPPTWASLSQWGIKVLFTEICGNYQNNNFQKKIKSVKFYREMPRLLKQNPWGLPVGF